jgi:hypothetical protein
MNLVWAGLVIAAAAAAGVAAILLVRRRAPEGGYFNDGDRAAGVFGVLTTGFALLLGFVIFLVFTSYDESRTGAETEALVLVQQFETAQFLPATARPELTGELICYGRSVVHQEWPRMESGTERGAINPWAIELFRTLETIEPRTAPEQSAYDKWLDHTFAREEARRDRIHGAEGVIPLPVWLVLFFSAAIIFVFMLFFGDSGERAIVQGLMIGSVVAVMVASLLVLRVLDRPFQSGVGGLRPIAMQRTLNILDEARGVLQQTDPLPCDGSGRSI